MSLTCRCGKASIQFTNSRPRKCIECCCCDCTLALEWCRQNGGPLPSTPPITLLYFDNDIEHVRGEEHLHVVKLRDSGASLRIVSTCCHTHLAVDHWAYLRNRIMVLPGCKVEYEGGTVTPEIRIQTKWWDAVARGPLPNFHRGPSCSYSSDTPWWAVTCGLLPHFASPMAFSRQGESLQQLITRLGRPVVVGIPEPVLEGHRVIGLGKFTLTFGTIYVVGLVVAVLLGFGLVQNWR
jgi:hypothetical protein